MPDSYGLILSVMAASPTRSHGVKGSLYPRGRVVMWKGILGMTAGKIPEKAVSKFWRERNLSTAPFDSQSESKLPLKMTNFLIQTDPLPKLLLKQSRSTGCLEDLNRPVGARR